MKIVSKYSEKASVLISKTQHILFCMITYLARFLQYTQTKCEPPPLAWYTQTIADHTCCGVMGRKHIAAAAVLHPAAVGLPHVAPPHSDVCKSPLAIALFHIKSVFSRSISIAIDTPLVEKL